MILNETQMSKIDELLPLYPNVRRSIIKNYQNCESIFDLTIGLTESMRDFKLIEDCSTVSLSYFRDLK